MSSKSVAGEPSFGDPYDILGLSSQSATETEINKAYRKLSLQLHPDKQHGKSDREKEAIAKRFHVMNEARVFLLDPKLRKPYDAQRASKQRRQEQDMARERSMTDRRRQMREELSKKEAALQATRREHSRKYAQEEELLNNLRKDGKRRRQDFAEKAAGEEYQRSREQRKKEKQDVELRQIRLKWSRQRISISPSEHSIAELMSSKFGKVEAVEMMGKKGNSALVTFASQTSCKPCVEYYAKDVEMRAHYVIERNEDTLHDEEPVATNLRNTQSAENIHQRQLRQAAERERLMREMQQQEERDNIDTTYEPSSKQTHSVKQHGDMFPLQFPETDEIKSMSTPLQKLQYMEREILRNLASKALLEEIQI